MKDDLWPLLGTQLSAPVARILFALVLVPVHPSGSDLVLILGLAELLSTFLTCGRNYLVSSGFSHHLTTKWFDVLILGSLTAAAYPLFATDEQRTFVYGVVVMTAAITVMTMGNAFFFATRRLGLVLPLNLLVYSVAAFGSSFGPMSAVVAIGVWLVFEGRLPSPTTRATKWFLPVAATLLAFASQRIDIQVAALARNDDFLRDVFQLNALFMPLALLVRLVGNTALLRGRVMFDQTPQVQVIMGASGLVYGLMLWLAGRMLDNELIVNNIVVLLLTALLSTVTVRYRELIAVQSRASNFSPLFWFSVVGIVPGAGYWLFANALGNVTVTAFMIVMYLAPRVCMFGYGWLLHRAVSK